jgi:hypothetical protein
MFWSWSYFLNLVLCKFAKIAMDATDWEAEETEICILMWSGSEAFPLRPLSLM